MHCRKRQEINLDVSSHQGSLDTRGKLPNRRNCLLRKYWQAKSCQPGAMSLGTRNSLGKCHWPLGTAARVPTNWRPRKGQAKSLLPSVRCTYAPCMSHPFLVFGADPTSKIATAEVLWGSSSIAIPKYLRMSQLALTFFLSSACFFFCYSFATLMISKVIKR